MTLQQLRYVVAVAESGSITDAAQGLFLSQPSLSAAIKELEKEIKTTLFQRTARGVRPTDEGAEFLAYARGVLQQMALLEGHYLSDAPRKQRFTVSTQHYAFTANAFVALIKEFGGQEYEFTLRETATATIIEDVKTARSELGILYLSQFNKQVLQKLLGESGLLFHPLFCVKPHIFISRGHPLAAKKALRLDELESYPCLAFEQGDGNAFYFAEEVYSTLPHQKTIKVTDRAAIINLLIGVDAFTIATGVFPSYLNGDRIMTIPLVGDEEMQVGVVARKDYRPTPLGQIYWDALRRIAAEVEQGKI